MLCLPQPVTGDSRCCHRHITLLFRTSPGSQPCRRGSDATVPEAGQYLLIIDYCQTKKHYQVELQKSACLTTRIEAILAYFFLYLFVILI